MSKNSVLWFSTSSELSTVSYNSYDFLKSTLIQLYRDRWIWFYCFIKHDADSDDKKEHFHVFIVPNGTINTKDLDLLFTEPTNNPDMPRKCMLWFKEAKNNVGFGNWYYYVLHDPVYLFAHDLTRNICYDDSCFESSDDIDGFSQFLNKKGLINRADLYKGCNSLVLKMCSQGMSLLDIYSDPRIHLSQVANVERVYNQYHKELHNIDKIQNIDDDIFETEKKIRIYTDKLQNLKNFKLSGDIAEYYNNGGKLEELKVKDEIYCAKLHTCDNESPKSS